MKEHYQTIQAIRIPDGFFSQKYHSKILAFLSPASYNC